MRLALFASGSGTNAGAIFDAVERRQLAAEVAVLISDRPRAGALDRAAARDIPTAVVDPADFPDEASFAGALLDVLAQHEADTVALAGYLRKVPDPVVWAFQGRMLNVHPSLLPAFGGPGMYGRRVHEAVLAYGCRLTGATVHLVDAGLDTGPVVLQEAVEVHPDDTPETLAAAVLAVEHDLLPRALRLLAAGRLSVEGRLVRIDGDPKDLR
ncbi:MAG TPA: phosphoribosylglycinamide formyltransferase [Rubricoccaceae bacterium]|jgi:phosphoribosylglycinamide formyltransferase-1